MSKLADRQQAYRQHAVLVIDEFTETTYQHFKSFAYAAGALSTQLADVLSKLPADDRAAVLAVLTSLTEKYSAI